MAEKKDEIDIQSQLLLRELEDEHRRAQLEKLWKAYAPYALGVAIVIVAGVGGFKVWQNYATSRAEAMGARYEEAVRLSDTGKADEARAAFAAISQSGTGYATLARLQSAAAEAKAGRKTEAVAAYDLIAADSGVDPMLRDFARLQAAIQRAGAADWTEMQNRLNDLVRDGNAWRFSARELWAVAAIRAARPDEARRSLEQLLADRNTPPSIGQRAQIMMGEMVAAELAGAGAPKKE
ncbi:MAG: tetratricopeptide repeat protein [Hyphomicrobiaceae bacterium]|jgi:hypothetical protein